MKILSMLPIGRHTGLRSYYMKEYAQFLSSTIVDGSYIFLRIPDS